jgi:hypothetical protein
MGRRARRADHAPFGFRKAGPTWMNIVQFGYPLWRKAAEDR